MFGETNYTRDSAGALEERKLLQQMVSLGVGYPHGRSWFSEAAISDANTLRRHISGMLNLRECLDVSRITQENQNHIRNGDNGYYLLDLHKGCILARGQHPIEDIIIDFTFLGADDRVLLRRRKGTCFHETGFLIAQNAVFFLGMNRFIAPLKELHVLSFICLYDNPKTGFVVDYDVSQSNRPLILFPCEENNGMIQEQLDDDDRYWTEESESLFRKH